MIKKKKQKQESKQKWYEELIEDIERLDEGTKKVIIISKWEMGKRIIQEELKFNKPEYGGKRIENLSKDVDIGTRVLYENISFAKKYPNKEDIAPLVQYSWREMKKELSIHKQKPKIPPLPQGKYNIIYADPPWQYFEEGYKNQSQHYNTMEFSDIKNLKIQEIAADNCILFLWITDPMIDRYKELLNAWGFKHSTVGFYWIKKTKKDKWFFGLGNRTRANPEQCLIGIKGSIETIDNTIPKLIISEIEEHSKKPDIVRDKIVQLVGDLPRIELFARKKTLGWETWGNQI